MSELLKAENYLHMPWANGLGSTEQIALFPATASVSEKNFLWRLSSATIQNSNPFSLFPDFQRLLIVVRGNGLLLNQRPLMPFQPIAFSGSIPMECDLISGEVLDLGLIFDPKEFEGSLQVLTFAVAGSQQIVLGPDLNFIYAAEMSLQIGNWNLQLRDTLKLENISQAPATVVGEHAGRAVLVNLRRKKSSLG